KAQERACKIAQRTSGNGSKEEHPFPAPAASEQGEEGRASRFYSSHPLSLLKRVWPNHDGGEPTPRSLTDGAPTIQSTFHPSSRIMMAFEPAGTQASCTNLPGM